MQAIGLLETKGLLAAIEGADVMVKSADVSILDKAYVGGGLVTITVTGDVGAVKASIEAGAAAVQNLSYELLISHHVIPRPHEELEGIIGRNVTIEENELNMEPSGKENMEAEEIIIKGVEQQADEIVTQVEKAVIIATDVEKVHKDDIDKVFNENGIEKILEALNKFKVVKLRNLAREYKDFGITGRAVSKADKNLLLLKFKAYYEKK